MSQQSNRFAQFLRARRAQLKPEDMGFPVDADRRVPGLKREEVAVLAGISVEYYVRLEQGQAYQLSAPVLRGLSKALKLNADATEYFYRLALPEPIVRKESEPPAVSDGLMQLIAQWSNLPVCVYDRNQDVIYMNELARALFPRMHPGSNTVMTAFAMHPSYREREEWQALARTVVSALRFHGNPSDPRLREIVGALSVREPTFRRMWADHHVVRLTAGIVPAFVEGFGIVNFPWHNLVEPGGLFVGVWPAPENSLAREVIEHLRQNLKAAQPGGARRSHASFHHQLDLVQLAIEPSQVDDAGI